jgi:hypothetical protein
MPKAKSKPGLELRYTFSDMKIDYINPRFPVLPFNLTFELYEETPAEPLLRITIPGCLWVPLQDGADKEPGKIQFPQPRNKSGSRVPGARVEPEERIIEIELALRNHKDVIAWQKKLDQRRNKAPELVTEKQKAAIDEMFGRR